MRILLLLLIIFLISGCGKDVERKIEVVIKDEGRSRDYADTDEDFQEGSSHYRDMDEGRMPANDKHEYNSPPGQERPVKPGGQKRRDRITDFTPELRKLISRHFDGGMEVWYEFRRYTRSHEIDPELEKDLEETGSKLEKKWWDERDFSPAEAAEFLVESIDELLIAEEKKCQWLGYAIDSAWRYFKLHEDYPALGEVEGQLRELMDEVCTKWWDHWDSLSGTDQKLLRMEHGNIMDDVRMLHENFMYKEMLPKLQQVCKVIEVDLKDIMNDEQKKIIPKAMSILDGQGFFDKKIDLGRKHLDDEHFHRLGMEESHFDSHNAGEIIVEALKHEPHIGPKILKQLISEKKVSDQEMRSVMKDFQSRWKTDSSDPFQAFHLIREKAKGLGFSENEAIAKILEHIESHGYNDPNMNEVKDEETQNLLWDMQTRIKDRIEETIDGLDFRGSKRERFEKFLEWHWDKFDEFNEEERYSEALNIAMDICAMSGIKIEESVKRRDKLVAEKLFSSLKESPRRKSIEIEEIMRRVGEKTDKLMNQSLQNVPSNEKESVAAGFEHLRIRYELMLERGMYQKCAQLVTEIFKGMKSRPEKYLDKKEMEILRKLLEKEGTP